MTKVKKLPLLLLLLFMSCLSVQAEEVLVVHLKNGGQSSFAFSEKPVITFDNENMVIKSNVTTFSVSIADVSYYDFPASSTGIQENQHALPLISNGHVVFSKLPADSNVNIYTVDGKQLRRYAASRSGNVDIDLTTLPKGVYVISSPITKIKITNR